MPVIVKGPLPQEFGEILMSGAMDFVVKLHRNFGATRNWVLKERQLRQARINAGELFDFLPETKKIRESDWTVNPVPLELQRRWVEITGPASNAKMNINAMKSGANVYMADAEDSDSPTWLNVLQGQLNLKRLIRRTLRVEMPEKVYELKPDEKSAVLFFRPRGWHLTEKHVVIDGEPVSASLFDFGMYFFHNARELLRRGTGPYFYLPKMESHLEAKLWNEVFLFAQGQLGIPAGTIKATVLVETLPAAFEMDEILYELKEHSAGLNCGRWDYIFSYIKKLQNHSQFVLPDRGQVTMDKGFLSAYVNLLIQTCHKRGAFAMGGMAAQIPIKNDQEANEKALAKVRADKLREVKAGHDGTWVAHPGLVPIAMEIFKTHLTRHAGKVYAAGQEGADKLVPPLEEYVLDNQLNVLREEVKVIAEDLLRPIEGEVTEAGLRTNISIGIQYLEAWLRGSGCVPLNNLMEDAATAEISRAQVWQWRKHGVVLSNGQAATNQFVAKLIEEELEKIHAGMTPEKYLDSELELAAALFRDIALGDEFEDFLTLPAYSCLEHEYSEE